VAGCVRPLQPGGSAAARLRQAAFFYLLAPDRNALRELALVLSAAAARMEPQDAAKAIAGLNQAMPKNISPFPPPEFAQGLSALAARMEPNDAAALTQAMATASEPYALLELAQALSAVAARIEPRDAARLGSRAGEILTQAPRLRCSWVRTKLERVGVQAQEAVFGEGHVVRQQGAQDSQGRQSSGATRYNRRGHLRLMGFSVTCR
jgi:hypothetical protein